MSNRVFVMGALCLTGILVGACEAPLDESSEDLAEARLSLSAAPPDARCITITVTGDSVVSDSFELTPGQPATLHLTALPSGEATFHADAYASECAAVTANEDPTWVSVDVETTLNPGELTEIGLVMRRNSDAAVEVDWVDDNCSVLASPCVTAVDCCSGICSLGACALDTCEEAPQTVDAAVFPDNTALNEAFAPQGAHLSAESTVTPGTVTNSTPPGEPSYFIIRFDQGGLDGNWTTDRRFRARFDELTDSVTIDARADSWGFPENEVRAVIEAYSESGQLLSSVTSPVLGTNYDSSVPVTLTRPQRDISYVVVYGQSQDTWLGARLSNLRFDGVQCD